MSAHNYCRFCKRNLFINGNYQNTKKIFDRKPSLGDDKSTYHRLKELGLPLCLDRSRSFRMCRGCFRSLGKIEYYFALFKRWVEGERERERGVQGTTASSEEPQLPCEPGGEDELEEPTPQCPSPQSPPSPPGCPDPILAGSLATVAEVCSQTNKQTQQLQS